jgi:hypothetical protein
MLRNGPRAATRPYTLHPTPGRCGVGRGHPLFHQFIQYDHFTMKVFAGWSRNRSRTSVW